MRAAATLLLPGLLAIAGCAKHPPAGTGGPLFKVGEEWAFRYRDANGTPCVVVLRVTDYVDPFVYGVRLNESCTAESTGTFVPDGPEQRTIDITSVEGVGRPGIPASPRKRSAGEQVAAGFAFAGSVSEPPAPETSPTPTATHSPMATPVVAGSAANAVLVEPVELIEEPLPPPLPPASTVSLRNATVGLGGGKGTRYDGNFERDAATGVFHGRLRYGAEAPESMGMFGLAEGSLAWQTLGDVRCPEGATCDEADRPHEESRTSGLIALRLGGEARWYSVDIGGCAFFLPHPDERNRIDSQKIPGKTAPGVYLFWSSTVRIGAPELHGWLDLFAASVNGLRAGTHSSEVPIAYGVGSRTTWFRARAGIADDAYVADLELPMWAHVWAGLSIAWTESGDWIAASRFSVPIGRTRPLPGPYERRSTP